MELVRQRRPTVVRRVADIPALDQLREEGERSGARHVGCVDVGAENAPSGPFATFRRTHEQPNSEESCVAFLMAIDVAPPTRPPYARMLRSMLEMSRTPLEMAVLGLQKISARSGSKQARPLKKQVVGQFVCRRTGWKQRVPFRLARVTATRWPEIAALNSQQFCAGAGRDHNFGLVRGAEDGRSGSHRASRFVRTRGQGAFDMINLCGTPENSKNSRI
ncbi:hypothetical protein MOQ_006426 [Trypanosoma cruzi marinkellei]|uniref:Uncharacterized protein n=1 Tax=Trypanosoma cruzi marinkellei TaxID=85056 RepID=K2MRE0_TRYCR|nr:hypothetical protein MOQ_006616 [Trypanosoma cruzi marinkellei]EKF29774.1 hypothetical protein MOQ_006426 [Trypanosoma cruzi marinkellei]